MEVLGCLMYPTHDHQCKIVRREKKEKCPISYDSDNISKKKHQT